MRRTLAVVAVLAAAQPPGLAAQFVPDARTVPAGALRLSFVPRYQRWHEVYDAGGDVRPLGFRFLTDSSAALFTASGAAEAGLRTLADDPSFVLRAGTLDPNLDADHRRFPLGAAVGLTSWLTLQVEVPIVTTTVNALAVLDTTGANAGLALGPAPGVGAALAQAAGDLAANIAAGQYGCPGSAQCAQATATRDRAAAFASALASLEGTVLLPLDASAAGQQITANLAQLEADLASFGIALGTPLALALPAAPLDSARLATLQSDPAYGYGLVPLDVSKHTRELGDVEVGLRLGLFQRPGLRLLLSGTLRLPTAGRGRPADPIDLPPGDRQLDVVLGLEGALDGGRLGLWVTGAWELQRPGERTLRLASDGSPFQPAAAEVTVTVDPGDIVRLGAWPSLRLTDELRVLMTVDWTRRGDDAISGATGTAISPLAPSGGTMLMIGGGLWYRSTRGRHVGALPIEAGLVYRNVYQGTGDRIPRASQLDFGLRLYYGVF